MKRRQTAIPHQWLIIDGRNRESFWGAAWKAPGGTGLLLLMEHLAKGERERLLRKLRRLARMRSLMLLEDHGQAKRVHSMRELRRALQQRPRLILLSPIFPTRSHPDWKPMPRMRAATLARLAKVPVLALGGMTSRRFGSVEELGFSGWAGIDAWAP